MAHTLTPLEQEVLDEYTRLLHNMDRLSTTISTLATSPTAQLLDALRELERKTGLVFTLLKASVYSIVLQQQLEDENLRVEMMMRDGKAAGDDPESGGHGGGGGDHGRRIRSGRRRDRDRDRDGDGDGEVDEYEAGY